MNYDLGCGDNKRHDSWVGIDIVDTEDVDIVADLREGVPFDKVDVGSASYVRIRHFLEHLDRDEVESLLLDVKKLCVKGALVEIVTPYYLSDDAVAGDHKSYYSEKSFRCYDSGHDFPTPKPQFLEPMSVEFIWSERNWVQLLRFFLPDDLVKNIPNAVQDIRFVLKVVEDKKM